MTMAADDRKNPTPLTQRRLYTESGNRCSFRDCTNQLHMDGGKWIAQMAHIHDVSPHTDRFDRSLSEEELRSYDNLILVCSVHHKIIDTAPYPTADELRRIKRDHIKWVSDRLSRGPTPPSDFLPRRKGIDVPQNMLRWSIWRGYDDDPDDAETRAATAGWFVENLEEIDHLSSHVALIVALLARDGEQRGDSLALSAQAALERSKLLEHEFGQAVRDLDDNGLGGVDEYTGLLEVNATQWESLHAEVNEMFKAGELSERDLDVIYSDRDLTVFDHLD